MSDDSKHEVWGKFRERFLLGEVPRFTLSVDVATELNARDDAGLLPEHELRQHMRDYLFQDFGDFAKHVSLKPSDVDHARSCNLRQVKFVSHDCPAMTKEQFAEYRKIGKAADKLCALIGEVLFSDWFEVQIQAVEHLARCVTCGGTHKRAGVLVTVHIGSEKLSREYAV